MRRMESGAGQFTAHRPWTPERRASASARSKERARTRHHQSSKALIAAAMARAAEENERVRRQRIYLSSISGPLRDAMVRRMLDRVWALFEMGEFEAGDAILEFVPEGEALALIDEYFPEFANEQGAQSQTAPQTGSEIELRDNPVFGPIP